MIPHRSPCRCGERSPNTAREERRAFVSGFTLLELLVVVTILAILASLLLPALAKAGAKAKQAKCASHQHQWSIATALYLGDFEDTLPLFAEDSRDFTKAYWHAKLAPYVLRPSRQGVNLKYTEIFTHEIRSCPGGSTRPVPFSKNGGPLPPRSWNCWLGANFGPPSDPLGAPFYDGDYARPLKASRILKPADALMFMDTVSHYVYSPANPGYSFTLDMNRDGTPDTMPQYPETPFNFGRPTVHREGSNVVLLDGHVEHVAFAKLWKVDASAKPQHSFWYLED